MTTNPAYTGLEVAVIGMACRFPGADDPIEFWNNLVGGVESIRFLTKEELAERGVGKDIIAKEDFIPALAVLNHKDVFDASFFGYTPDEAALMNPVHRIFHECVWEALENAGYDPFRTESLISLYAGTGEDINWSVYSLLKNRQDKVDDFSNKQLNSKDYLTSLLSYKLNLKGPSFSVNTACSTSLVAVNLAVRSLLMGEANMALAGGASISTTPYHGYFRQEGMIYSSDGHCRAFDKNASGTVGGEGAGVVVLKRLKDAMIDRDHIYCIIKGGAINNDGHRKVGFSAPSVDGQSACIKSAHKFAKIRPDTISYVEAHGTGTKLGDPVEIMALNEAFGNVGKVKFCAIGSVKTNIGHLDAAAGIAGLIKTALCLKNTMLPPSLHFSAANPEINFDDGPFFVNDKLRSWRRSNGEPLRAAVSSFGIGGTNAHLVLEEAPAFEAAMPGRANKLLTLSAQSPASLARYIESLKRHLRLNTAIDVDDLAFTSQVGRHPFSYRHSLAYRDYEELVALLDKLQLQREPQKSKDRNKAVVFLFPGQGAQYAGMSKGLYEQDALFREEFDKGFLLLEQLSGENLRTVFFASQPDSLGETNFAQPMIFLLEYALAKLLIAYGINPAYLVGHSLGEYAAACIAGVFSLEDGLRLVIKRGRLMKGLPAGEMISVAMDAGTAVKYIEQGVSLAAVNAPDRVVFSGSEPAMEKLKERLLKQGWVYIKLNNRHAFHSEMVTSIVDEFRRELQQVRFQKPAHSFLSNLTGNIAGMGEVCTPEYWIAQMLQPVRFSDAIANLLALEKDPVFVEAGPGQGLCDLLRQHRTSTMRPAAIPLLKPPSRTDGEGRHFTEAIGRLWALGVDVDWKMYYNNEKRRRIPLPAYSFEPLHFPAQVDPLEDGILLSAGMARINGGSHELKDHIYYPVWKIAEPSLASARQATKRYLLFSPGGDLSEKFRLKIAGAGNPIIDVLPGKTYDRPSTSRYIIDGSLTDHFGKLFNDLDTDGFAATDIIYWWNDLPYTALVCLMQCLAKGGNVDGMRITVITDRLYDVIGNETVRFDQALLLGPVTVFPQEYNVICRNIDISMTDNEDRLIALLSDEIAEVHKYKRTALRHGRKWLLDYQKNTLEIPPKAEGSVIKNDGVYLLTGGLGNVGYVLARHVLQTPGVGLAITGLSELDDSAEGGTKRVRMQQLKKLSSKVFYYRADVADMDAMKKALLSIESDMGPIKGVIHAAGNVNPVDFELVEHLTLPHASRILSPKVAGIQVLYELFRDKPMDFLWATSSLSSAVGGVGYAAYASANSFLEQFIVSKNTELPNWKCICLGELLFSEDDRLPGKMPGREALRPHELVALFEWSLRLQSTPVILETVKDLAARLQWRAAAGSDAQKGPIEKSAGRLSERPELSSPYIAPVTDTERRLTETIEIFFGIGGIGTEDNFFELGGDSLKAMRFQKRIENEFDIELDLRLLFENSTVKKMAEEIDEKLWIRKGDSGSSIISII